MYDKHGWIVFRDVVSNQPCARGDACFHMGLQAMNYCMLAEKSEAEGNKEKADLCWNKAWQLWLNCMRVDFIRHPTWKDRANSTSFDMMVIWDFVVSKWPVNGFWLDLQDERTYWWRPTFHYRKSKYWSGQHRARWMFWPIVVVAEGLVRLAIPPVMHRYFQGHIFMLKAATTYENTKNRTVLGVMRRFTKRIEKITNGGNPFYRWLARMSQDRWPKWINWGQECTEWMFQRDVRLKKHYEELYGSRIEFHKEEMPNGEKLYMHSQFLRLLFWKSEI